jgi:Flp pilus assembly protein TadG
MLLSRLNTFATNTRGNIALITALAALPLFGAAGVAVDVFRKGEAQSRLQAALDAGALAGATSSLTNKNKIRKIVRRYVIANGSGDLIKNSNAIKVRFANDGTITVSVHGKMKTTISSVLGFKEMNVSATSQVKAANGGAEVALVLDTTDSMNSEGRIVALRSAASQFLGVVDEANQALGDRIKISLVPYATYVNVGKHMSGSSWLQPVSPPAGHQWHGCVGSREYPLNTQDKGYGNKIPVIYDEPGSTGPAQFTEGVCAPEIVPLTTDQTVLSNAVNGLTAGGLTYIPAGLMWGWRTLSDSEPYTEGEGPTNAAAKNIKKYVVLMTDGLNTMERNPGTPYLVYNGDNNGNFNTTASDNLMLEICKNIKDSGTFVFTIGFKLQQASMKAKMEKCASSPENYYDASSNAQLSSADQSIAKHISSVHLSK